MLNNGQTYFRNLAVFTPQDFQSMFGHFTTLCMKGLIRPLAVNPLTTNVPYHIETSQLIGKPNQLAGFYMMGGIYPSS